MTAGERMVWAAVYAASWHEQTEFKRRLGGETTFDDMARTAASEATFAVGHLGSMYWRSEFTDAGDDACVADMLETRR